MGNKIKVSSYYKRCAKSRSYGEWTEEYRVYKKSTNSRMGMLTSDDMLYATKKNDKSILSEEYIEARNVHEGHARMFMEKYSSKLKH